MWLRNRFFKDIELYGDDFSLSELQKWCGEEEEGYAKLIQGEEYTYQYQYMNEFYGFRYIADIATFKNVLGFGSAFGHEFMPIISRIQNLTIIEPSEYLHSSILGQLVPRYIKPNIDGVLNFPDSSFDLITCFGVLHHIPNVTAVLTEIICVLEPHGILLLREPIRAMGDWRFPRKGLTKNERGIPHSYFERFFRNSHVEVVKRSFCDSNFAFQALNKLFTVRRDTHSYQVFDSLVSKLFRWNVHYHPTLAIQKIAPASIYYVVRRKGN